MSDNKTYTVIAGNMKGAKSKKILDITTQLEKNNISYAIFKSPIDARSEGNILIRTDSGNKTIPAYTVDINRDFLEQIYEIEAKEKRHIDFIIRDEAQFLPNSHTTDCLYLRDSNKKSIVDTVLYLDFTAKHFGFLDPSVIAVDNEGDNSEGSSYTVYCHDCYLEEILKSSGYIKKENYKEVAPHLAYIYENGRFIAPKKEPGQITPVSLDRNIETCILQKDIKNVADLRRFADNFYYMPSVCKCGNPAEYPFREN